MVSLSQMARLVEAVRPDARLILVGDPGQLTSIEAGAVLGDIVGPADDERPRPAGAADHERGAADRRAIVVLDRVHRYGGAIARVAEAIRRGDADAVVAALEAVTWLRSGALDPVRDAAVAAAEAVTAAARAGAAGPAIEALGAFRVLCAHRRDVAAWTARVEGWAGAGAEGDWYVGRPLLVTENDYGLGLFNGDTGVVIAAEDGRVTAAFERSGRVLHYSPARLSAVETVYAMTVHKSQGSQFDTAAVLLPDPSSPLLTRELLYTAVTRARRRLILVGPEDSIRAAVARPVARASGLRRRLWR
jgi:exodeoxyribonuclease V alpha subunit